MHFNRAGIVYGIMILLSASGVWAVLSIGQRLIAPDDLAGKWTLETLLISTRPDVQEMTVEQSGKFFQISFENGPKLNLVLDEQSFSSSSAQQSVRLALTDGPWHLTFQGPPDGDEMQVALTGPKMSESGVWNAKRLIRKFPPDFSNSSTKSAH